MTGDWLVWFLAGVVFSRAVDVLGLLVHRRRDLRPSEQIDRLHRVITGRSR